jgi:hypothetical protein
MTRKADEPAASTDRDVTTYPYKAGKLVVLEKLRNDSSFKLDRILDDKRFAILGPARHGRVTGPNQFICLCVYK